MLPEQDHNAHVDDYRAVLALKKVLPPLGFPNEQYAGNRWHAAYICQLTDRYWGAVVYNNYPGVAYFQISTFRPNIDGPESSWRYMGIERHRAEDPIQCVCILHAIIERITKNKPYRRIKKVEATIAHRARDTH